MNDLQVIDVDPNTRKVFFVIKAKQIKGISKLVQIVVLSLMNSPERDVLDPELGSGVTDMIGTNIDPNNSTEAFGDIAQAIKKIETEIINAQIGVNDPAEEKLANIQIMGMENGDADEILVKLRVINQSGQISDVVV